MAVALIYILNKTSSASFSLQILNIPLLALHVLMKVIQSSQAFMLPLRSSASCRWMSGPRAIRCIVCKYGWVEARCGDKIVLFERACPRGMLVTMQWSRFMETNSTKQGQSEFRDVNGEWWSDGEKKKKAECMWASEVRLWSTPFIFHLFDWISF